MPALLVTAIVMWGLGTLFLPYDPAAEGLRIHAVLFVVCSVIDRWLRRRDMRRGVRVHTFYMGDSLLEGFFRRWPRWFRKNRRISRFCDPAFAVAAGLLILWLLSPIWGLWVIFAGLYLRFSEAWIYHKQVERQMDLIDSLVESEAQLDVISQFAPPPNQATQIGSSTSTISTGLSPDVERVIRARRVKRSGTQSS